MSYNLLDLYRNLDNFVKTLDEDSLAKLQCPNDYLKGAESDLHRISTFKSEAVKEIGTSYQDYKWFLSRIVDKQLHPYQIFLNKLISNLIKSEDISKAYHRLLALWRDQNGDISEIEAFSTQNKQWAKQQVLDADQIKLRIDNYVTKINQTLDNVNEPLGLIPLALRAWVENPEYLIAFIRWLSKSKTDEEIINSGLLHELFIAHFTEMHDPSACFSQLYKLMQQPENELTTLIEMASQTQVDAKYISDRLNIKGHTKNHSLTGKHLSTQKAQETRKTRETSIYSGNELKLILPNFHNSEAYLDLFGLEYLICIILSNDPKTIAIVSTLLNKIELEEIAKVMEQINSITSSINLNGISNCLSMEKLSQMIEQHHWIACRFMTKEQRKVFVVNQGAAYKKELITVIKEKNNVEACLLLIAMYDETQAEETLEEIYETILDATFKINDIQSIEEREQFLNEQKYSHMEFIQRKAQDFHKPLQRLAASLPASGLTTEMVHTMLDTWRLELISFNHFKYLYPNCESSFPSDKYARDIWIISLEYEIKKENFDLYLVLNMIYGGSLENLPANKILELKHLLKELLLSTQINNLQQQIISVVNQLIENKTLEDATWQEALNINVDDASFIELIVEHNNILLYQSLTGKELDEPRLLQAVTFAQNTQNLNVVQEIVAFTGKHTLNRKTIEDTLSWAMRPRPGSAYYSGVIQQILALTGANKPDQKTIITLLHWAINHHYHDIVQQILALTGENKPNQTAVSNALAKVYDSKQTPIAQQILAMTGENKPNQVEVVNALLYATNHNNIIIVQQIIAMTGENKPNQIHIGFGLMQAASHNFSDITSLILAMTGENKPRQSDVRQALIQAAPHQDTIIAKQTLAMTGENKPSQKDVDEALKEACDQGTLGNEDLVVHMLGMTSENKPSPSAVNCLLERAKTLRKPVLIAYILAMTDDNKPDDQSVADTLVWAKNNNYPDIAKQISQKMENEKSHFRFFDNSIDIATPIVDEARKELR